jgi:putative ABC transport system permease protein
MLKNHLKIALRNLKHSPGYAAINIFGLAVAMAVCILIGLYVQDELSYDDFHENAARIFLVAEWAERNGEKAMFGTGSNVGENLEDHFHAVENVVRTTFHEESTVEVGEQHFKTEALYAEADFFDMFTFPLLQGNPKTALNEPQSVVLTEEAAAKYFGNENPMGQTLSIQARGDAKLFTVTGVVESVPSNSYFSFDFLLSASTIDPGVRDAGIYTTFALLNSPEAAGTLRDAPPEQIDEQLQDGSSISIIPLSELYLSDLIYAPGFKGDPRYLYVFSAIALFILVIACSNYINLATARSARHAQEVGVRKTVGAGRFQIARQFLSESVLLSVGALFVALLLVHAAHPAFNALFGKQLQIVYFGNTSFLLGLVGLVLLVGIVAGGYPALYLANFQPVHVLKSEVQGRLSGARLRKALVVFQFAVSIVLLIGTAVIYRQLHFMQTKDLGFNEENVVVLPMGGDALKDRHQTVKQVLSRHANILDATASSNVPGDFRGRRGGVREKGADRKEGITIYPVNVDADFLDVLGMRIIEGRNFSAQHPGDRTNTYILNEAAVRAFGWQEAVGKEIEGVAQEPGQVIGVVEDFHFTTPRRPIAPVVFQMKSPHHEHFGSYYTISARIRPEDTKETLAFLEEQWNRFVAEEPFEYSFLAQKFDEMYEAERRLSKLAAAFAAVAVLIACLGLFGLGAFAAEQRTKEIGIRKVLGASLHQILLLLSRDFVQLVLIGFVIAAPIAYYVMRRWLQDFAYRVELSAGTFLLAGIVAVTIALLTVSYQSIKAALTNPADSLRYE